MAKMPAAKAPRNARPKDQLASEEAVWSIRDAKRLRTDGKGSITQAKLAEEAGVGDDTVSKIERGIGVTRRMVNKVFEALNVHYDGQLMRDDCVRKIR